MSRTTILRGYLQEIPLDRLERYKSLLTLITMRYPDAVVSLKHDIPTFETAAGWVALANRKHYISLHMSSDRYLAEFKDKHPDFHTGESCINFQDHDTLPLHDILDVIVLAMDGK